MVQTDSMRKNARMHINARKKKIRFSLIPAACVWICATLSAVYGAPVGVFVDAPLPPETHAAATRLRVAVSPASPAVEWKGNRPIGVMIDVWEEIARRIGVTTDFVSEPTFSRLFDVLIEGGADVSLGPLAITEEREEKIDFTHPIFHSGSRIAVRQRSDYGISTTLRSFVSWQLLGLCGCVMAFVFLTGHLLWWCERRDNPSSFPPHYVNGVVEAMWWIACTIVSGGCDNKYVASRMGRAIGFAWMIGGIVLLATFTSVLTATMTAERVVGAIHGPRDLAGRTVGCQQAATSRLSAKKRGAFVQEFPTINEALVAMSLGMVEAVVAENQSLIFFVNQPSHAGVRLVGPMFETFDYGLAVPNDSPLREKLNKAILQIREDGTLERIKQTWLGNHE